MPSQTGNLSYYERRRLRNENKCTIIENLSFFARIIFYFLAFPIGILGYYLIILISVITYVVRQRNKKFKPTKYKIHNTDEVSMMNFNDPENPINTENINGNYDKA